MTSHTVDKPQSEERTKVRPRTDVFETSEALILVADVPGAEQDSIELALTEGVLTLRARSVVNAPSGWNRAGSEFELPDYECSFRLATDIDPDALSATLRNGCLRVVLKKRQARSNRIEVRTG